MRGCGTVINPLKPYGTYMYNYMSQSVTLYFVFMGFCHTLRRQIMCIQTQVVQTDSQNNFWIIIQKEDDHLEDHLRDY
jgi:hypothetical protein